MRIGCVVLASGDSVRFGSNKLLAPFRGKALIRCTLDKLPGLFERTAVVTRTPEIAALADGLGFLSILHELPDVSDTIRLGVEAMEGMDGCLFMVGDQPLLSVDSIKALKEAFSLSPQRIARAHFQERWGNPVLFPKSLFGELSRLSPGQLGGAVIRRHEALLLPVEVRSALELCDADTRAQLETLEQASDG